MEAEKKNGVTIRIKLIGIFRIDRFREAERRYHAGVTVREVVADLRLPEHMLGIVVINDGHAGAEAVLEDGDTLALFPLLDGG